MKNSTDITIILDRSGSMSAIKADTIGGFNQFLTEQQALPGEANISLFQFDNEYEQVFAGVPIKDAVPLNAATFVPRGATALLDAIGRTVNSTGARLGALPEEERPDKVVVVIITDGEENASKEFRRPQIYDLLTTQRETYNWQFIFLAANQDAIAVGGTLGVPKAASLTYAADSAGARSSYYSVSESLASLRTGAARNVGFSDADRDAQKR